MPVADPFLPSATTPPAHTPHKAHAHLLVSTVSAVYNGEAWLEPYLREVHALLAARFKDFEIVIVDNGSTDGTVACVERLQHELSNIQLYCLMRHWRQESAFVVGLEQAVGDVIISLDANYDPPAEIVPMLALYDTQQVDVVYGIRAREDNNQNQNHRLRNFSRNSPYNFPRKLYHRLYHRLARWFFQLYAKLTDNDLPVFASTFRLFSRRALNSFLDNPERYSLFRVIGAFAGLPYTTLTYQGINRSGKAISTNYASALYRGARMLLLSSHESLRLLSALAVGGALLNIVYSIYVLLVAVFKDNVAEGWTSLSLQSSLMFFLLFLILGVLAEYVGRMYIHSQNRPPYYIARERRSLVLSRKDDLNITVHDDPHTSHQYNSKRGSTDNTKVKEEVEEEVSPTAQQ